MISSSTSAPNLDKAQIVVHSTKSLNHTAYDVRWIPCSPRFVSVGQTARGTGILHIWGLENGQISSYSEMEKPNAFKCGTFGASSLNARHLATGDFDGRLCMWDLEKLNAPVYSVGAHDQIINHIDGCGGTGSPCGPPELATASRDGSVKVWDVRQSTAPVATMAPEQGAPIIDCWTVAFGNSYNDEERSLCAGYENGDIKMFDLRTMKPLWETNLKNGICSIEFDRKDIKMNKFIAAGLEAKFHVFDARTLHPTEGFSSLVQKASETTTLWAVRHLPQNRDVFMVSGGAGGLSLYRYKYPEKRVKKDAKNEHDMGVMGKIELINNANVADQPIGAFDWSPDKMGLCAFAGYDQAIRVGLVTRLDQY